MSKQDENKSKSSHLQSLEDAFEKRTRRFSAFDVLGLDKNGASAESDEASEESLEQAEVVAPSSANSTSENTAEVSAESSVPDDDPHGSSTHTHVDGTHTPVEDTHPHGSGLHSPVSGTHSKVVVKSINTTTLEDHTQGSTTHTQRSGKGTHVGVIHTPTKNRKRSEQKRVSKLPASDVVATANVRSQLGVKARKVLGYLDRIRSIEVDELTVPVGYGKICSEAGVDHHYLRRNVIPKLAMLGLLAVEHKDFHGTIYRLQCSSQQVELICSEPSEVQFSSKVETRRIEQGADDLVKDDEAEVAEVQGDFPDWIDKKEWGWLSFESIGRLVLKAGSEAKANEKLDILIYNESHGPEGQRVRNRRSVLSHYLRSDDAEIWPNDDGFETIEMKRAKQEIEQAKREKDIAEQALTARQEARKAKFLASLRDEQLSWFKQEAKSRVDARPEAKMVTKRYPLYKAEEEDLVAEWMERCEYGETVPGGDG